MMNLLFFYEFLKLMCRTTFKMIHKLYAEEERQGILSNLRRKSMVCVKFLIRTEPAWELGTAKALNIVQGGLCSAVKCI